MKATILLLLCTLHAALTLAYQEALIVSVNTTPSQPELTSCIFPDCLPLSEQELHQLEQTDQGDLETVTISKEYLIRSVDQLVLDEDLEVNHLASTADQYVVIIKADADAEIRDVDIHLDEKPDLTSESKKYCRIASAAPDHFYRLHCPVTSPEENPQIIVVTYKGMMWNAITVQSEEAVTPVIITLKPEVPRYTVINSKLPLTYPERLSQLTGLKTSSEPGGNYDWLTSTWTEDSVTRMASGSRVLQVHMLHCLNCLGRKRSPRKTEAPIVSITTYPDIKRGTLARASLQSTSSQLSIFNTIINQPGSAPPAIPLSSDKNNLPPNTNFYKVTPL